MDVTQSAGDDLEASDAGSHDLDLTPRRAPKPRARRGWAIVVIVLVLGALAFVATKALSDASLFFYNADEAVAKRDDLGDSRFRLQGTVESGTIVETGDGVDFTVYFNGVDVDVHHRGDPPELFKAGEPVVLEGRWDRSVDVFSSDRMLVKHDEEYDAENEDRIKEAEQGGLGFGRPGAMNLFLGSAGVLLGLSAAVLGAVTLGYALLNKRRDLQWLAVPYTVLIVVGAVLAVVAMERALITRDFTVKFVADNGSSRTPALYNVATLWAALEGSILLWALILSGYTAMVVGKFRRRLSDPLVGWAVLTMFVVAAFFFFLMAFPANPFQSFDPPPGFDGPGPNPLLQNHPLMAFHPPMLYLGYVGFTVPFAFAIAALATGRVGEGWLVATRRWTLFAWGFLTVGIVLGAWWSYEVLGWGGYWAWDPVENASLLPWLTGTAYLHSVMVQERRGMLRVWNLSLLCATFSLTILGTFITRSGVLDSVHAFTESAIGPSILAFFTVTVVVTVGLIGWRGDRLRAPGRIDSPLSREAAFLGNNVLFAVFAFVVLLGTVFPLLVEAINDDRVSVGTPYFNRMITPIALTLLFLMAVAPVLPWRKASGELLRERLFWPAWVGTAAMVIALLLGGHGFTPMLAYGLAGFAAGSAVRQLVLATRRQGWRGLVGRANGGMVVHLGVILIAVAFAASQSAVRQAEFTLAPGQQVSFAGHTLTFITTEVAQDSNKTATKALVEIDGTGPWAPALNQFAFGNQTIGTPSVRSTPRDDVALTLLALPTGDDGTVTIRVTVQPLVVWLWVGGGIMAFGTILAAFPGRRRDPLDPVSAPISTGTVQEPEPAGVA